VVTVAAYDELLERHRILRDGGINGDLTKDDWDRFAHELAILLREL
jgi:hypothetical protein